MTDAEQINRILRLRAELQEAIEEVDRLGHNHSFADGPYCAICGLHAVTVEGGALSPRRITDDLRRGKEITSRWPR